MTTGGERTVLRLPVLRALLAQGLAAALVVVLVYLLALLPWRMSLFPSPCCRECWPLP